VLSVEHGSRPRVIFEDRASASDHRSGAMAIGGDLLYARPDGFEPPTLRFEA
jgi:hypothetical protein